MHGFLDMYLYVCSYVDACVRVYVFVCMSLYLYGYVEVTYKTTVTKKFFILSFTEEYRILHRRVHLHRNQLICFSMSFE